MHRNKRRVYALNSPSTFPYRTQRSKLLIHSHRNRIFESSFRASQDHTQQKFEWIQPRLGQHYHCWDRSFFHGARWLIIWTTNYNEHDSPKSQKTLIRQGRGKSERAEAGNHNLQQFQTMTTVPPKLDPNVQPVQAKNLNAKKWSECK